VRWNLKRKRKLAVLNKLKSKLRKNSVESRQPSKLLKGNYTQI
jgi:hypothetical protein